MFDDIIRGLERLPQQQLVPIDVVLDDDGYFDRTCPAPECGLQFKVLFGDWKEKVPEEVAYCAICGEDSEPSDFNSEEQQEHFNAQALAHLTGQLDDVFRRATPRRRDMGFISMTLTYQPGARPVIVPAEASPAMTQRSECESCGCHYASIGAAFFCAACGHNSARSTFGGALTTVRASMDLADRLSELIESRDESTDLARHFAEDGLVRLWSSFQRFAEATYGKPARRNAFQNLDESNTLWQGAMGKNYADFLSPEAYRDLVRLVQARHVLAHKDGLVDADYVAKSGDTRYRVGQRLVINATEARRLADIVETLSSSLTAANQP